MEFGEGVGHVVRKCQRWSLVEVPCCQVSEVEFGGGAMLSGSVKGGVW